MWAFILEYLSLAVHSNGFSRALPCRVDVQVYNKRDIEIRRMLWEMQMSCIQRNRGLWRHSKGISLCRISEAHPINTRTILPKLPDALCPCTRECKQHQTPPHPHIIACSFIIIRTASKLATQVSAINPRLALQEENKKLHHLTQLMM